MPTEADWKRRVEERKKSEAPNRAQYDSLLQQAVVASDLLTSHPAWDVYLQRLQVDLDKATAELGECVERIAECYQEDGLRMVQIKMNVLKDRILTLHHCMSLPKEIISHAHDTLDSSNK